VNAGEVVGRTLAELGVRDAFGVLGSGNFVATLAMHASGVAFHHARHEGGAICMADGYARVSGRVGVCSVHQGPGFTNTMTGLTEAAKARTPLLLIAGEAPAAALRSNFRLDQAGLAETVGAVAERVGSGESAAADTARAFRRAEAERRPVLLSMPLDVLTQPATAGPPSALPFTPHHPAPAAAEALRPAPAAAAAAAAEAYRPAPCDAAIAEVAELIAAARRPLILAGRGAVLSDAREPLEALGDAIGAVLATSAMGHGLFAGSPWAVGISGGFASPLAARLISASDLILAFGTALTRWTTKDGSLISPDARVVHVDLEADAAHRPVDVALIGDAAATARALLDAGVQNAGVRDDALAAEIATGSWRDEPYDDVGGNGRMDPRTLSIALDALLPGERTVAVDSGHFMGFPPMYLRVPDPAGFVFTQAFQSIGLGLASGIGAAIARPDRLTLACLGDGGALMSLPELETLARLRLPMLVVVYNDAAYGAEVHHFRPHGHPVELVQFPDTDFAALASAAGAQGVTVRGPDDLAAVEEWLASRDGPLIVDAKITPDFCAEWLEEAFK
jgi:thiamine pyrophosphate-dependent acetolactate synthase large subunit-like protein